MRNSIKRHPMKILRAQTVERIVFAVSAPGIPVRGVSELTPSKMAFHLIHFPTTAFAVRFPMDPDPLHPHPSSLNGVRGAIENTAQLKGLPRR